MCGNGREKKCIAEQSEGIAKKRRARQGHSMAAQRTATQGKGIDKLSIAMAMRRMGMKRDAEEKQRRSFSSG